LTFYPGKRLPRFFHPFYYREFAIQMDKIGIGSLFIIILTGTLTGIVMTIQFLARLKHIAATSYVGGVVAITIVENVITWRRKSRKTRKGIRNFHFSE